MREFIVDIREFRGSSYEIGLKQGNLIDNDQLNSIKQVTKDSINTEEATAVFNLFAPHLVDEIHGLADGVQLPFDEAMRYFSGYDLPKVEAMGCSSLVTRDYFIRNYDFSPLIYDHQLVLLQPDDGPVSTGYSLHYIGRHEGINEHGLAAALHFVNNENHLTGLMCSTIMRIIADTCKTTDDCIQLLKELPHACAYNYSIGDQHGNFVVIEASPDKVEVRQGEEALYCTNHFQSVTMKEYNRRQLGHSEERKEVMSRKNATGMELFEWFSNPNSEMFYDDYENFFGTLHTFAYFFKENRFLTKIACGVNTLDIKLDDWAMERPLPFHTLKGRLPIK